jgi:hypothetical protein
MKKTIITLCLIGSTLLVLDNLHAANSLFLFLFAGIVPGTNILIPATYMLIATATAMSLIVLRIIVWPMVRTSASFCLNKLSPTRVKRTRKIA